MQDISPNNKEQCKINKLKVKWYNWLYLYMPKFQSLGLDERGMLVECVVEHVIDNDLQDLVDMPDFNSEEDAIHILSDCTGY